MNNENTTGILPDEEHRDDERADENEAPIREVDDATEAPEEFEIDGEDEDDIDDEIDDEDELEDEEE